MPEIKKQKNYFDKRGSKGKMTNVPLGHTGHESSGKSGKLTKKGQVYRNDLLDADLTSQIPTRRKLKGVQ
jgi:hypothetical protein